MPLQTTTQSVTNSKIAIAAVAAFIAVGMAFAAVPVQKSLSGKQCQVESVVLRDSCGVGKGYKTASISCGSGKTQVIQGQSCISSTNWNIQAQSLCTKLCKEASVPALPATGARVQRPDATPQAVATSTAVVETYSVPPERTGMDRPGPKNLATDAPVLLDRCGNPQGGFVRGKTYKLSGDVQMAANSNFCFFLGVENVLLDCDGHSITGNGDAVGVSLAARFTEVRNCHIDNVRDGITLDSPLSSYAIVRENTITRNGRYGIYLSRATKNDIVNNTVQNVSPAASTTGITLDQGTAENYLVGNSIMFGNSEYAPQYGIQVGGERNVILNNTIQGLSDEGITLSAHPEENWIVSNSVRGSRVGVAIRDDRRMNYFSNNTLCGNVVTDLWCPGFPENTQDSIRGTGNVIGNISVACPSNGWPVLNRHYTNSCQ